MDDNEEIRLMLANGVDANDVAEELGIPRSVVYRVADEILAERREERNKLIIAAYKERWPIKAIRKAFDVSTATVYNVLDKSDVPRRNAKTAYTNETDRTIIEMYGQGAAVKMIQIRTGATLARIYKVLDRNNVPRRRPHNAFTHLDEARNNDRPASGNAQTGALAQR